MQKKKYKKIIMALVHFCISMFKSTQNVGR